MRPDTDERSTLCRWHPSRRAVGFCEACGRHLCQPCVLDGHPCTPRDPDAPGGGSGRRLAWVTGAVLLGGVVLLPLVARFAGGPARTAAALPMPPDEAATTIVVVPDVPAPVAPTRPATPTLPAGSFDRGSPRRSEILLSFDAAENTSGAEEILSALERSGVRTTFFITGQFIRAHPDLVRRLLAEGHEVANHTDTHPHLTTWTEEHRHGTRPGVNAAFLVGQLQATAAAFQAATGVPMARLWRAPYGEHNSEIRGWAEAAGWRHVGWTAHLDSLDWVADPGSRLYRPPEEIARRLLSWPTSDVHAGRGGIILMHIGSNRAPDERLAILLPGLIAGYRSRGLEFVTASAMMRPSHAPQGG